MNVRKRALAIGVAAILIAGCDSSSDSPDTAENNLIEATASTSSAAVDAVPDTRPENSRPASSSDVDVFSDFVAAARVAPQTGGSPTTNLFTNSGFENGLQQWSGCSNNAIELSNDAFRGDSALRIKPNNCFYRSATVEPGVSYKLTCRVKLERVRAWTGMGLSFSDSNFNELDESPVAVATAGDYALLSTSAVAPARSEFATMWLHSDHGALVDNCRLKVGEVSNPTTSDDGDVSAEDNILLNNPNFTQIDSNGDAKFWSSGCDGNGAVPSSVGLSIANGTCVDQSFNDTDLGKLRNKKVTFSCRVDEVQGYSDMNLFFDGELVGNRVLRVSDVGKRASISADVRWVSSGFVSMYSDANLHVSRCRLATAEINGGTQTGGDQNSGTQNGGNQQPMIQTARYRLTFRSRWSAANFPVNFPSDPHFSGLVGGVHNSDLKVWAPGEEATQGVKLMAETGDGAQLLREITEAVDAGTALSTIAGASLDNSPGRVSIEFDVTNVHDLVSITSMIAPSPDWFVGIHDFDLYSNGAFVDQRSINLYAYDSGTDSGRRYTSDDNPTNPVETIARVNSGSRQTSIRSDEVIGQFIIERLP